MKIVRLTICKLNIKNYKIRNKNVNILKLI